MPAMSELQTPPVNTAARTATQPTVPRRTPVDPFVQLLNMQLDWGASSAQNDAGGLNGWAGLLGGEAGLNPASSHPLLTVTLVRLLQRLIDAQDLGATQSPTPDPALPEGWPVEGRRTQAYHAGHRGLDLAVPIGTPIRSTMAGRVVHAGWNNEGYGNLVIVENGPYRTYYAHLDSVPVNLGQTVAAGDVIGLSGNTGNSTGPHLHYEVRVNGQPVEPGSAH